MLEKFMVGVALVCAVGGGVCSLYGVPYAGSGYLSAVAITGISAISAHQ